MQQPDSTDDIELLAQSAHRQLGARKSPVGRARSESKRYLWVSVLWAAVLLPLTWNAGGMRTAIWGLPQSAIRAESVATLEAARAAVDSHRKITGAWPDRVPLAALDALVRYEPTPSGYLLTLQMQGMQLVMDQTGQVTERKS